MVPRGWWRWPDTEVVSISAVVHYVGQVLGRAHSLFGDPPESGGVAAGSAGAALAGGTELVRSGQAAMSTQSGRMPAAYAGFATGAGAALDDMAGTDTRLGDQLGEAAATDHSGRSSSAQVVNSAAVDTAAMAPISATPAGQQALLRALRARVSQERQVVAAYRERDARMSALLRSLAYGQRGVGGGAGAPMPFTGGGGIPSRGAGGGFGGGGGSPLATLAGLRSLSRGGGDGPHAQLGSISDGPARRAVLAALSKRGTPYVWGAKGPSNFDCSGLTQWAWRQAGVQLGGDTYSQFKDGIPVPPDQVRAGDLIFPLDSFGEDGRPGPGHVELALGPDAVVHAPHTGDVVRVAPMPGRFIARRPVPPMLA